MSVSVDALCARLREVPDSFRQSPSLKNAPPLNALVADTILHLSGRLPEASAVSAFEWKKSSRQKNRSAQVNYFSLIYVLVWLFNDACFHALEGDTAARQRQFLDLLEQHMTSLAALVDVSAFIEDTDRREELVRICLKAMDLPIDGESKSHSADRLQALDSVARHQLIQAAQQRRKEEERQRLVAEAARRKKEEEQAARYNREW